MMPITYALLTPLALFTLDSGSWETRGKPAPAPAATPEPQQTSHAVPTAVSAPALPALPPPGPDLSIPLIQPVRTAAGGAKS